MATIAEIRKKYPQYEDLSDTQLADSMRAKFYSDIPQDDFYRRVGLETSVVRDVGGALVRGAGQIVSLPGQLFGLATSDMDNISTRAGRSVDEFGEGLQTPAFRERQRQQAERVAAAEKDGLLSGFGQQAKELLTDPLSLAAGVAQTLPAMIGTGGLGFAARVVAKRLIGQQAVRRGALAGAAAGESAIVSGDAAQSTYERVSQMPQEVLARSDAYQAAIAEGATPEDARNAAAISAARRAVAIVAPIAAITGPLGIEAALLTGGVRRGLLKGAGEGIVREGGTEITQETGQGVAENVGAQTIDPNVALTEGLGGRAAAGLILGGTMGGAAGAISGLRGPEVAPTPLPPPETEPTVGPPRPPSGEGALDAGAPAVPSGTTAAARAPVSVIPEETVTVEDDQVIIESPDGGIRIIPRAEYEATLVAGAPPAETVAATSVTAPIAPAPRPFVVERPSPAEGSPDAAPTVVPTVVLGAPPAETPTAALTPDEGPGTSVPPATASAPSAPTPTPTNQTAATAGQPPVAAPAAVKPPRVLDVPAPKAATTMQGYISQIAKTFKKGQNRISFGSAVYHGVDPDWLNSRPDLRRMFGKDKLTRGRDGKVVQNRRQIDEKLTDFADFAMSIDPSEWGVILEDDQNGYVSPQQAADLINNDAPRLDTRTGAAYEQETQEDDGLEATMQSVSIEANNLGVELTDADMRAIAEQIGYDGDPLQGIVDYVSEQFEEVMAEARDYSEYDAGQEEFPNGPVTNIEDSTAEPGGGGQAAAPRDAGQGQANREQPTGATGAATEGGNGSRSEEGSLGLSAAQPAPSDGMTERQRAEMAARLQQSQIRRGSQQALDQQEGGMFDASRDQGDLLPAPVEAPLPEAYAPILQEYQAIVEKPTPEAMDRLRVLTVRDISTQGANMAMSVVQAPNGALLALPGPDMVRNWQRSLQGLAGESLRSQTVDQFYDYEGFEAPLQVTRPAIVDANGNVVQRGILGKAPATKASSASEVRPGRLMAGVRMDIDKYKGGTLLNLLEEIFANLDGKFSEYDMYLAGRISALLGQVERAGLKVKLNILQEGDPAPNSIAYGGAYGLVTTDLKNNTIDVYLRSPSLGENSAGNNSEVVLHEALHAVSSAFIIARKLGRNTQNISKFVNELGDLRNAVVAHFNRRVKAGAKLSDLEKSWYARDSNVFSDLDEFLAWGMTNAKAQEYLRGIKIGPQKNLFQRFVSMFKGLLNIPDGDTSALGHLIEIINPLFEATEADYKAVMGAPVVGSASMSAQAAPPRITPTKETRPEGLSRKLVDRFERLRVVQNLGQLRQGVEGFYEAARKFDSRAGELVEKFDRDYFKPIQKIMKEANLNLDTVDGYLYARAAPARNARLQAKAENEIRTRMEAKGAIEADIDAAIAEAYADDKIPEAGSGITTDEANDILLGFAGQDYSAALERIGELFNRANRERMENNIKAGLVSREGGERLLREEPDYVPMKGSVADENLTEPAEDYEDSMGYGGSGFGVSVREWYNTRGRSSLPFSPLGTFISDVGTSVVRGERNRVGQKMMDFFIDNPSDSWRVFSYRNPPRDRNGNVQRPSPFDPNFMVVKRGGETFYLRIEDPLLAKAAKNLNPTQMGLFLQISNKITRLLSRSFTTANPDFFVPNVFRDLQSAALNLAADAPGLAKAFGRNIKDKKAFRAVAAFEYGRESGDPALRKLYEQFKLDGGSVSWVQRETPEEAVKRIQSDLKTVNDSLSDLKDARTAKQAIDAVWSPTGKGFRAMVGALESTNATFENAIRFAAYRAAIEIGLRRDQAAMVSREATVDFNRRGEAGAMLNALYAFFNAGIQGSVRTARALSNNPFKTGKLSTTQAALLAMMGTAATLAAANAAISDEDDDGKLFWDKIPDYEKERNLIIMNPLDGRTYAKIPMPYGFGFFPYLATRTMDAARRGDDLGAAGIDIVTAALGNFSPIQFSAGNIPSSISRAATPTVLRPLIELALNENFMGKPIYNEPFDRGQSYASVARNNTPEGYKDLAQFLNQISGGEGKVKGNLNVPAESLEYLVEFSLGGVTNLAKSLYRTGDQGDALAAPVVRRLVGQPSKGRNVGEYYEREEKSRAVSQQMKDLAGPERRAIIEKFPVETHPRVQDALTSTRSAVRKLNQERKRIQNLNINDGEKAERLEIFRERIDAEYVRFNRVYNQVDQATR